ncbi:MAG: ligand-binding sensor domain-containing protein [Salibacteraceae bacterium]
MKIGIRNISIWVLYLMIISCNGQVISENQSASIQNNSDLNKIVVPKNGFSSGLLDSKGNLWFTSNGGGVYHFDGLLFTNYTEKNGLSSNQVFSITEDSKNNMWIGTQNGLTKFSGNQFESIPLPYQDTTSGWMGKVYPVLSPNAVHSLATDNNDNIWIGTGGGGAYRYNGNQFKPFLTQIGRKQEDSSYHNWIPFIRKDNQGNIWFASMTHGGVNQYDGEKFTQFLVEDGLSDTQVRTIYCDKSGKIWIGFNGSRNSGLTVYDGTSFYTYSKEDGLCNKRIRSIYEDKNGNLWLGSHLGNLCVYDGQNFSEFNSNGRTFADILFVLGDSNNNVWFGGVNGIWKFDGQSVIEMTTNN